MKIVIAAGGTGGHIYPGIAVAQEIKRRDPQASILFLGSPDGLEKELIPRAGFTFKLIRSRALIRKVSYKSLTAPIMMLIGFFQSLFILKSFTPQFVLATGGYVSLPVLLAAKLLGIRMIILEQNVLPGVVNRLCAKLGGKVFLSFSESLQYLSGEVVGNPVRQEIYNADRLTARRELGFSPEDKVVLIMGGSQGARTINKTVLAAIPDLPVGVKVVHLIGQRDFAAINAQLAGKNYSNYFPKSYVHEMANLLAAADLVVSRAGATAISEFLARSLPMILIPFPFAAADHQRLNAAAVVAAGRAKTISDADFTPASFIGLLGELVDNYAKIDQPRAAKRIVDYFYA